jgi:hypothetical protein
LLIHSALLNEWDPIGVSHVHEAHDEYDAYVPDVLRLLASGASTEELFRYLWQLETEHMGLDGDRPATERFAARLLQLRPLLAAQ